MPISFGVMTMLWTIFNLVLFLLIPATLIYGIFYVRGLSRRIQRLEERLDQKEQ